MGLRICLVTPFAWSQPHDVNEHVSGLARALRARGHEVTVLAPSSRAADLLAGRRALLDAAPEKNQPSEEKKPSPAPDEKKPAPKKEEEPF